MKWRTLNEKHKFSPDDVKELLLSRARQKNILDLYLSRLIVFESVQQKVTHRVTKPTTQLFLDLEKEESLLDDELFKEVTDEEANRISSEIKSARDSIDADFDF